MPKKHKELDKKPVAEPECESWSEDQKRRGYYYDDAHGYEDYDVEKTEEDEEEED